MTIATTARQSEDRRGAATAEAAARLQGAAERGVPCAPFRDLIGTSDVALAYAVQQRRTQARLAGGARIVGHKIGLTSLAVQRQLKVDRPDFGVLFDDMDVSALAVGPYERLLQPKIEAEIAFVLGEDLSSGPLDVARVRQSVEFAMNTKSIETAVRVCPTDLIAEIVICRRPSRSPERFSRTVISARRCR